MGRNAAVGVCDRGRRASLHPGVADSRLCRPGHRASRVAANGAGRAIRNRFAIGPNRPIERHRFAVNPAGP